MLGDPPARRRVRFGPDGMAYRPGEILVREEVSELATAILNETYPDERMPSGEVGAGWVKIENVPDLDVAWDALRANGVLAQPNHVLFATVCCPPHPSGDAYGANPFLAHPFLAHPFLAHPFLAHPVLANPFLAHPFLAHPFLAHSAGGCCCCGGVSANPFLAHATPNPAMHRRLQGNSQRKSSAKPAAPPQSATSSAPEAYSAVRVAILDTGYAQKHQPSGLPNMKHTPTEAMNRMRMGTGISIQWPGTAHSSPGSSNRSHQAARSISMRCFRPKATEAKMISPNSCWN